MAYYVVKTIKGRQYLYKQESKRVNGKVVTKSIYVGPVQPTARARKRVYREGIVGDVVSAVSYFIRHDRAFKKQEREELVQTAVRDLMAVRIRHAEDESRYKERCRIFVQRDKSVIWERAVREERQERSAAKNDSAKITQPSSTEGEQPSGSEDANGSGEAPR